MLDDRETVMKRLADAIRVGKIARRPVEMQEILVDGQAFGQPFNASEPQSP